jgi:hypothetical protein
MDCIQVYKTDQLHLWPLAKLQRHPVVIHHDERAVPDDQRPDGRRAGLRIRLDQRLGSTRYAAIRNVQK